MTVNVQFVYGAGNDTMFGGGLRWLQSEVAKNFTTSGSNAQVYMPRILDYTEMATLDRLVSQWKDPTILIGHSCGCMSITAAAIKNSMKKIPFLMACAPSIYCPVSQIANNVQRAHQETSWWGDFFNPGGRTLLSLTSANNKSKLTAVYTNLSHINTPYYQPGRDRLISEIKLALEGK